MVRCVIAYTSRPSLASITLRRALTAVIAATMLAAPTAPAVAKAAPPASTRHGHHSPQEPPEHPALHACIVAAEAGDAGRAAALGRAAESAYRQRLAANAHDVEALVGIARALTQCLLPGADLMLQGELSTEAMDRLDRALELDPDHWLARYLVAVIAWRSPSFLGRGARAAREFDELLRRRGDGTDNPLYARVFEYRGLQLSHAGHRDSAHALWTQGATLFPHDSALRLLARRGARPDTSTAAALRPAPSVGPGTSTDTAALVAKSDTPSPNALETVSIVAERTAAWGSATSVRSVARSDVLMTPGAAADVLHSVQLLPGATRVTEGSDVYVRGGNARETALLVNGGRVLSLSRFESLNGGQFGALDPYIVSAATFSSGGYTARHGNVLSGVIDIETDGRPRRTSGRVGLSLVQVGGTGRVAVGETVGGWVSARFSHLGPLLASHARTREFDGSPYSGEVIGSLVATPTSTSELRLTGMVERDASRRLVTAAGWSGPFGSDGALEVLQVTGRWVPSRSPVVVRGSVTGSRQATEWRFGVLNRRLDEQSAVSRLDAEWEARAGLVVRGGVEYAGVTNRDRGTLPAGAGVAPGSPHVLAGGRARAQHVGSYGEVTLSRAPLAITAGVRADRLPGEDVTTFDPRLAVAASARHWTISVAGGVFHQGRWRPPDAVPDSGVPSGAAMTARHAVLGIERRVESGLLRVEAYYKRYADYGDFGAGPPIQRSQSRGIDLMAQRSIGTTTGVLAYSYLDATLRLVDGRTVRSPYDVTHSLTASGTIQIGESWSAGTTLRYGTGAPHTPIVGSEGLPGGRLRPLRGPLMSQRLPSYGRIDARLMRFVRLSGAVLVTFVEVINLSDRRNVAALTYDATYSRSSPVHSFFARRTLVVGGEVQFP